MRKIPVVFLVLVVAFLVLGVDLSGDPSGDHPAWRVSHASPADAQSCVGISCPCIPDPGRNLGDPDRNGCGDPINFGTGNKYQAETDHTTAGPFPLILKLGSSALQRVKGTRGGE
jgi:hypothetical protein